MNMLHQGCYVSSKTVTSVTSCNSSLFFIVMDIISRGGGWHGFIGNKSIRKRTLISNWRKWRMLSIPENQWVTSWIVSKVGKLVLTV
jgi:hypothetical protein